MQISDQLVAPVLVLGVGNVLLGDDGAGPALLHQLQGLYRDAEDVECVDGGTQGLALLGLLAGRQVLVILDAFACGKDAGAVTVLEGEDCLAWQASRSTTAHEGNAGELLATANLLGELPKRVYLVGIEPENMHTGFGLSDRIAAALPAALVQACGIVEQVRLGTLFQQPIYQA